MPDNALGDHATKRNTLFLPDAKYQPGMSVFRWLVVIAREGVPEVTGFWEREDAEDYFDRASIQWSDSYLVEVVRGPIT